MERRGVGDHHRTSASSRALLIGAVSGAASLRAGIGLLAAIALLLAVSAARETLGRHPWSRALPLRRLQHPACGRFLPGELVDALASFVAVQGARGVVVFDGVGEDAAYGALEVRFASPADPLLERLAAEHRRTEEVWVVSSDRAVRGTAGQERRVSSNTFVRELAAGRGAPPSGAAGPGRSQIEGALDEETRERLERFRRSR